jgi:hypothetical protein
MLRLVLIEAILFLIPFALYFGWRAILDRREAETGGRFDERPWQMLIIAGGVLAIAGLAVFGLTSGRRGDTVYIPAHIEDGRVVPGRFLPADEAGDLARMSPRERANPERANPEPTDPAPPE